MSEIPGVDCRLSASGEMAQAFGRVFKLAPNGNEGGADRLDQRNRIVYLSERYISTRPAYLMNLAWSLAIDSFSKPRDLGESPEHSWMPAIAE